MRTLDSTRMDLDDNEGHSVEGHSVDLDDIRQCFPSTDLALRMLQL